MAENISELDDYPITGSLRGSPRVERTESGREYLLLRLHDRFEGVEYEVAVIDKVSKDKAAVLVDGDVFTVRGSDRSEEEIDPSTGATEMKHRIVAKELTLDSRGKVPWTIQGFEDGVPQIVLTRQQFEQDFALKRTVMKVLDERFQDPYYPWKRQWAAVRDDLIQQYQLTDTPGIVRGVAEIEERGLATGYARVDAHLAEQLSARIKPETLDGLIRRQGELDIRYEIRREEVARERPELDEVSEWERAQDFGAEFSLQDFLRENPETNKLPRLDEHEVQRIMAERMALEQAEFERWGPAGPPF